MLGYDVGLLALFPLLERLESRDGASVTLRLKDLQLGDLRFLSGTVRFEADEAPNGKA